MTAPTQQKPIAIEQLQREIDALRAAPGLAKVQHAERVGALTLELLADHCRRLDELERVAELADDSRAGLVDEQFHAGRR